MRYINPLKIYIVWHLKCDLASQISHNLFSKLCRNIEFPYDQRLGIPVHFRFVTNEDGIYRGIDFKESNKNVIICLIDNEMILDNEMKKYIKELYSISSTESNCEFIPVALTAAAYNFDLEFEKLNYVGLFKSDYPGHKTPLDYLYYCVLHELCKFVIKPIEQNTVPIKLFISHSKHDDTVNEAISFRDYINSNTQLKTFFDANDIGYGSDFAKVIEENAGKCVIVAFLSDTYSSREWCRNEVIIAKSHHCPIVLIYSINTGERRSFPYLGNIPTRKWDGDNQAVVNLSLETTLLSFYLKESLQSQVSFFKIPNDFILSNYPELFSIIGIKQQLKIKKKEAGIIIYPDPPLGNEELRLLNEIDDRLSFITPLQLSSFLSYE